MSSHITFIGAGNMATSLIKGLIASGHDAAPIRASDPAPEQLGKIAELGVATSDDNNAQVRGADVVILAVKPQVMASVAGGLTALSTDQLLVSIAAGVPMSSLAGWTSSPVLTCLGFIHFSAPESPPCAPTSASRRLKGSSQKACWPPRAGPSGYPWKISSTR